jgi:hypothetical protein
MTDDAIMEQFMAYNAAIKTILEVLIGTEIARPEQISSLLRTQAQRCFDHDLSQAFDLLIGFAAFAENSDRIAARRLPHPHGAPRFNAGELAGE